MLVELVNVKTSDGVRLDGALAEGTGSSRLGLDLVIFHHGLGSSFYPPSMHAAMAGQFIADGCSVLRVNNRGHDYAYSSSKGQLGGSYEIVDDFRLDCGAWLDFAETAGFQRIALWGHSLGAVKVIYYLAIERDPRIVCALASSPPRFRYDSFIAGDGGKSRLASFAHAEQLVAEGVPSELVSFELDPPLLFSADSLLDKYGPKDRYDFFRYLPDVGIPLLLMIGGLEGGFRFQDLADQGEALAVAHPNLAFTSIEGADHSYMRRLPEVWATALAWLESPGGPGSR